LLPNAAQGLAVALLPLTPVVNVTRGALGGGTEPLLGLGMEAVLALRMVWLLAVTVFFFILSINLMKKRLTS
jgi:hypothetical protein